MVQLMERIYLQCRGMGILFWIPLIGYYIIVPSAGWILGQNPLEDREMLERVTEVSYRFIPLPGGCFWYIKNILKGMEKRFCTWEKVFWD
jgi:hypothetical protein